MEIDINGIQDFLGKSSSKPLNCDRVPSNNDADALLRVNYAYLIDEATRIPDADSHAIEQAQELLESGELESLENIRAAAENITTLGI